MKLRESQPIGHFCGVRETVSLLLICAFTMLVAGCSGAGSDLHSRITDPSSLANASIDITDSSGQHYHFDHPVNRIVSQDDDATEMLIALGAGDKIVGITDTAMKKQYFTDKIPHAADIGDWLNPDIETIFSLKPDVIVSYATSKPRNLDKIRAANLTVIYCDSYRLNTLSADAERLGRLTGNEAKAREYIDFNTKYLSLVESRLEGNQTKTGMKIYAEAYTDYSAMTERSAGGQVLQALHAENIYGNYTSDWATVSPEWVIAQNPDIIIKYATDPAKGENLSSVRKRIMHRPGFSALPAVQNNRVYVINGDIGSSPRAVIGLVYAAKAIYPDKFQDLDPMDLLREYDRDFVSNSTDFAQAFEPDLEKPS